MANIHLNDYKLVSNFCRTTSKHGGSAIFCRKSLECKERLDIQKLGITNIFECSACELKSTSGKLVVICIYRPPSKIESDIEAFIDRYIHSLEILSISSLDFVIAGDFNINVISNEERTAMLFKFITESFGAKLTINVPTRVTAHSATCIDNIITNIHDAIFSVIDSHLSDHTAQKTHIPGYVSAVRTPSTRRTRRYTEDSINNFLNSLAEVDWESTLKGDQEPENMWNSFHQRYGRLFDEAFPLVLTRIGPNFIRIQK